MTNETRRAIADEEWRRIRSLPVTPVRDEDIVDVEAPEVSHG